MEKKINIADILSATVSINNAADADRQYAISAHATISGGVVQSVTEGNVRSLTEDNAHLASFSAWNINGELNLNFAAQTDRTAIVEAVENFIADTREMTTEEINL